MPGHMEIDGSEMTDQLARQDSSYSLIGLEPAHGISAQVARRVIWGWVSWKRDEYWLSICGQRQAKCFRKRASSKIAGELLIPAEIS